jgi:hypothetical protein
LGRSFFIGRSTFRLDTEAAERDLQQLMAELAGGLVLLGGQTVHSVVHPRRHAEPEMLRAGLFVTSAGSSHGQVPL